jgi:hypothetical protein
MVAVVAASGLAAASPMVVSVLEWNPTLALPVGGLTATGTTRMIGAASIRHYAGEGVVRAPAPVDT